MGGATCLCGMQWEQGVLRAAAVAMQGAEGGSTSDRLHLAPHRSDPLPCLIVTKPDLLTHVVCKANEQIRPPARPGCVRAPPAHHPPRPGLLPPLSIRHQLILLAMHGVACRVVLGQGELWLLPYEEISPFLMRGAASLW